MSPLRLSTPARRERPCVHIGRSPHSLPGTGSKQASARRSCNSSDTPAPLAFCSRGIGNTPRSSRCIPEPRIPPWGLFPRCGSVDCASAAKPLSAAAALPDSGHDAGHASIAACYIAASFYAAPYIFGIDMPFRISSICKPHDPAAEHFI